MRETTLVSECPSYQAVVAADVLQHEAATPKGLLDRRHSVSQFQLARYDGVDSALEPFVSHYWVVTWDLSDRPAYASESLPHPTIHIVFQRGQSAIFGVPRGKFVRRLEGKDRAFG